MTNYQLVYDYKDNQKYRESFNELAKLVFGLDFSQWYEKGCWNDQYSCYSYIDGEKVIANASISKMTVVVNGKDYKVIQVGTVMTHPDYRHKGLARKLMNDIIDKYEKQYDFIYLFANETVLDFYPKFGFSRVQESRYFLNADRLQKKSNTTIRKLNAENSNDVSLLKLYAKERIPLSSVLDVKDNESLLMFYFLIAFPNSIYFIQDEDVIVIFEKEGEELHLFDVVSRSKIDVIEVLSYITTSDIKRIIFHFIPDCPNLESEVIETEDDVLFIRPMINFGTERPLFPLTSHS
ncbi:GNAT family N-acetyltransferase [Lysinibacillus sp. KCTC 33748]|uniref:GNAT family N-acetyltransferase n=1 Tax=unclassified Lysinibacillus TaxID=2636778 RepID=UPI0009A6ED48|nr:MULTISPECIES: GNAT family N-acetyltransferase [unclassified Lysinibacillus]OXS72584.1 GNAT family N-acetyltransferase [Lysinibacillus sp. KCTC 33748]SKB91301.1 Acetyltransferase (GNAT) domain-containing protein [Lysinibacillus sp. AC-3]